jgi:hypothetical protein
MNMNKTIQTGEPVTVENEKTITLTCNLGFVEWVIFAIKNEITRMGNKINYSGGDLERYSPGGPGTEEDACNGYTKEQQEDIRQDITDMKRYQTSLVSELKVLEGALVESAGGVQMKTSEI